MDGSTPREDMVDRIEAALKSDAISLPALAAIVAAAKEQGAPEDAGLLDTGKALGFYRSCGACLKKSAPEV